MTNTSSTLPFDPARVCSKIDERDADDCWRWTGAYNTSGYGQFSWRSNGTTHTTTAQRAVYLVLVGRIGDGLELDHLCRNRWCVNPAHLEPVTRDENVRRAVGLPSSAPPADWSPLTGTRVPTDRAPVAGAFNDFDTRVLLAVMASTNPSVTSVAAAVGRARMPVHRSLCRLRDAGLVGWEPGRSGTLRALVARTPSSAAPALRAASAGGDAERGHVPEEHVDATSHRLDVLEIAGRGGRSVGDLLPPRPVAPHATPRPASQG